MLTPDKIILSNTRSLADLLEWISDAQERASKGEATAEDQVKLAQSIFTLSQTIQLNGYEMTSFADMEEETSNKESLDKFTPLGFGPMEMFEVKTYDKPESAFGGVSTKEAVDGFQTIAEGIKEMNKKDNQE